ncbi:MAG: FAD-dependent oxidoreductase [Peptococcaceae bacterium]|nr:FAD-dependent oxidoreductase [Peptococcaceae bacterium]
MALAKELYRELQDIVGPEYLSEEKVVMDGYAWHGFGLLGPEPEDRFQTVPEAVVLPGSTEDVQAIVKWANRRGVQFKPQVTAFGAHANVGKPGQIILDLRRMNRILEFDEKNMYMVVEPYVSFITVMAEAQKRGLYVNGLGSGSHVSVLASITSMHGNNCLAITQGYSGRNLLGCEWVLPTGDIVRTGALGSGAGWFSGDGPGPSLRGVIRGAGGAMGGLGVFTKAAVHLHPWPGPAEIKVKGVSPYYNGEIPPLMEYHLLEFPDWTSYGAAQYKLAESGILFSIQKGGGPGTVGYSVTGNNNEYYEAWKKGELMPPVSSFAITLNAYSEKEHAYQVKTLNQILADTGGRISPVGEKTDWKERDFLHLIKNCFTLRGAYRPTGQFVVDSVIGNDTIGSTVLGVEKDVELRDIWMEKGFILNDGTHSGWQSVFEGGHMALHECGQDYDPFNKVTYQQMYQLLRDGNKIAVETPMSLGWSLSGAFGGITSLSRHFCDYAHWMQQVKIALDPREASDPSGYISAHDVIRK